MARAILAMLTWRKRRKSNHGGRPRKARNTLLGQ
jgi:hypothetical protein